MTTTTGKTIDELIAASPIFDAGLSKDFYELGRVIGRGSYSTVRVAIEKATRTKYAAKCIRRANLSLDDVHALLVEVSVLKQMHHRNIIALHQVFAEPEFFVLVTEFVEGGELFDRIVEKTCYTEREARDVVKSLLEVTAYCHAANIVHRDLKPENILLVNRDDHTSFKLADFGFAKRIAVDSAGLVTACGTPGYVAPEVLMGKPYGASVDVWSIGVITYILLCGYPPFHDENRPALFAQIKEGVFHFHEPYWDDVSDAAKDLITKMLTKDPKDRPTTAQLLRHPWISGIDVGSVQLDNALNQLRQFNARRKLKATTIAVLSTVAFGVRSGSLGDSFRKAAQRRRDDDDVTSPAQIQVDIQPSTTL
ncbi:CAMK/CAMK1 protein kinase [Saprolegnia diclina VS20]|uniref:phosphorylase kinase n=1 Tax=Saprolegnia diclina (strain VS20) TaxID=1156394 RepID=T0PLN9_SAPDV|nr:CAMK/CAMK1 protein kinase [Saprolegnia diclina VS20]EQC26304.1 CAMK/CAMK1 protein kinase [Saprolegnia diclina VS20]|eukprot:XP_008620299.1 CAMK/CAMK1 protein kinase [Saprolegnia diclina VS20]